MFRKLHRQIHNVVQRLRDMASNNSANQDAELSKYFINEDKARGVDSFEVAAMDIPQTARPENTSPLAKTFAVEEEGKGRSSTRFAATPRPGPRADKLEAEAQTQKVPRDAWTCCHCDVTNPLVGPVCWQCKSHYVCIRCRSA
ncbi:hypothetical protein UCDDA912_g03267 [Diaporthe ampelina]|uniref:RanBP2-type domain-containing protein n=1 Tax=Diaporthe ampelina TaxID=1214573 RepID=A0A0G2HP85_9PEZI|nr:hypothetical protein UCDDA912_g03267 [Diaporthe ampelina]